MMACDEALMEQDTWFAAFLASSPTWTYADGTLTLTNGTDTVVFTDAPSGAAALEGTGWKLVGLISKTATANTVSAVDPTLSALDPVQRRRGRRTTPPATSAAGRPRSVTGNHHVRRVAAAR